MRRRKSINSYTNDSALGFVIYITVLKCDATFPIVTRDLGYSMPRFPITTKSSQYSLFLVPLQLQ